MGQNGSSYVIFFISSKTTRRHCSSNAWRKVHSRQQSSNLGKIYGGAKVGFVSELNPLIRPLIVSFSQSTTLPRYVCLSILSLPGHGLSFERVGSKQDTGIGHKLRLMLSLYSTFQAESNYLCMRNLTFMFWNRNM